MKIIIAEADRELCSDLCTRLRKRLPASSLEVVDDGRGLVERVMALHPVLVVLDTLLPGRDGLSLLHDLRRLFTYKGLDGCRMRNGFHFAYKGLHLTYHKTLPYSTIVEKGDDGVTYDILYDVLIKQNGEIHSDWTGVKMDVDAYRKVVYEPYDLHVINGTIDF